ncbi:MAG: hypothetical protein KAJ45_00375 [Desulfobulbaceae bacterium]|nr:hypothetical protein [Desulfobulbaceae bacterium]
MAGINTILSGFIQGAGLSESAYAKPEQTVAPVAENKRVEKDVFEQGQWWKNRTTNAAGQAPNYAVKAYQGEAGPGQPFVNLEKKPEEEPARKSSPTDNVRQPQDIESSDKERNGRVKVENSFAPKGLDGEPLDQEEMIAIAELKQIDAAVRAHEMAHQAAGGPYVRGGANYQYKRGPDGKRYAVAGEVQIDTSRESTPEKTIAKMRTVRAAALAPADPSPQDRKVAGAASSAITDARQEQRMIELEAEKKRGEDAARARENEGDSTVGRIEGSEASRPGSELSGQPVEGDNPSIPVTRPYLPGYSVQPTNNPTQYGNGGLDIVV